MMLDFGYYNMDCMDGMKQFPDNYFELAIVDPPYGGVSLGGYASNKVSGGVARNRNDYILDLWAQNAPEDKYFNELFRVSQNQIIWGGQLLYRTDSSKLSVLARMGQREASGRYLCRRGTRVDIVRQRGKDIPLRLERNDTRRYEKQGA